MLVETPNTLFWKAVEYLFYIFFITFPFTSYSSFLYTGTSTRSLDLIVFSAILGIALAVWLFTKRALLSLMVSPLFIALALYLAALTVSGFFGLNFSTTFWSVATRTTGIWYFLSLGVFMLMLAPLLAEEKKRHLLILSILFSTALYSVLDLLSGDGLGLFFKTTTDAFTFGNSSFAAMYIFGAFLLSLYYLFQAEVKKWWMYALPVVLLINPNIVNPHVFLGDFSGGILGEARASSFAIVLSLVALFVLWLVSKIRDVRRRKQVSYGLFGAGVLAALLASFSLLTPGGFLREAYLSQATAARPLVWGITENAIHDRPALGFGADNFERVFEKYYDNRLLQEEYGNEAWFDRAHNVLLDQLVDNGFIGLLFYFAVYITAILALIHTALRAAGKRDRLFAAVLIVYFTLHIAELQTAFDTSISYPMLAFMFVAAAVLYHKTRVAEKPALSRALPQGARYAIAVIFLAFFSWSLIFGALPLARAEAANGALHTIGSPEKRIPLYPVLFGSPVDVQAFLWRIETDFERGIAEDPSILERPQDVENLKKELVIFEDTYRTYVAKNPENFRAQLNLADVLIYQTLVGVDKLEEAQTVLDQAIALVPQSPQPYWMKAVAYLYMRKFDLARQSARKGLELNPKIVESQDVVKYIDESVRSFPDITFFFFRQI